MDYIISNKKSYFQDFRGVTVTEIMEIQLEDLLNGVSALQLSIQLGVVIDNKEFAITEVMASNTVLSVEEARTKVATACKEIIAHSSVLDSHCHLDKMSFPNNHVVDWVKRHISDTSILVCNFDYSQLPPEECRRALFALPQTASSLGIHPKHADKIYNLDLRGFATTAKEGGFVAVGETGICSKWVHDLQRPVKFHLQTRLFHFHVLVAKASGLPLILHLRSNKNLDCLRTASQIMKSAGLQFDHHLNVHCYTDSLPSAQAFLHDWPNTIFAFNVMYAKQEQLNVASSLPLNNLSVESDAPYLGKDPLQTDAVIQKIASLRKEDYATLKLAIRRNIKFFLQPCGTDPNTWAAVLEIAAEFKRKPTDLSVVARNVQFHTKSKPALKWSKN